MIRKLLLFILIGTSAQTAFAQQFNITPSLRKIGPSETATFTTTTGSGAVSVTWSFTSLTGATLPMLVPGGSGSAESYSLTLVDSADIPAGLPVLISATNGTVNRTAILMLESEPQVRRGGAFVSVFAGFGALGPLNAPRENIQIFSVPVAGTPQAAAFLRAFPLAGGLRLTTRFYDGEDELLPSPAMVAVSFGRHELVSGGDLKSWIGKFEGFYPLALGSRGSRPLVLYLFGRANLRFTRAIESTPLILSQAPTDVKADNPGVAIISQPSRRDMYTLGVGIDAVQLIKSIGKN